MSLPDESELRAQEMVARNRLAVVGQGIDFPLRFDASKRVGSVPVSNAGERIKDSIHLILATRPGERPHNPEFGSRLFSLVFEPNDEILQRLLVFYTAEALKRWEKRIEILAVTIITNLDNDPNKLGVNIEYTIRNSHIRGSFVYPFVRDGMSTSDLYTGVESERMSHRGSVRE